MTHVSVRIDDEELEAFLDDRESNSETVREALRYFRAQTVGVDDDRLTDDQQAAYVWLRDQTGVGGTMTVERAENELAQQLSKKMGLVRRAVLRPLETHGYIRVRARMTTSILTVLSPEAAAVVGRSTASAGEVSTGAD